MDPDLPREEGVVCSLKESFGFIYCADRPEELFFHYSQLDRSDFPSPMTDLQIDQEVTFQVGPSKSNNGGDNDKLAAYNVRKCEKPIEWELSEGHEKGTRFQGLVEMASSSFGGSGFDRDIGVNYNSDRPGIHSNSSTDGKIRVLMEEADDDGDKGKGILSTPISNESDNNMQAVLSADGPLVRFNLNDYNGAAPSAQLGIHQNDRPTNRAPRLFKGDLVEFEIVKDRRTKEKYARKIVLLQSEKERVRSAAEQKMLEEATVEHGVITSLKGEYGFLKSNKRREEVFFHYSMLDNGLDGSGLKAGGDMVLQEGQDMKFLVVTEGGQDAGQEGQRRLSARQVQMQPRGSVQFHDVIASCCTGVVLYPPQPHDSGHFLDQHGKVRLHKPVTVTDPETGNDKAVTEVYLHIKDAPGGSFQFRGGTSVGMWVQAGDTLLFNVVQDFVDGSCHAGPTASLTPDDTKPSDESILNPSVKLIELALAMRAEGVINNLKDTYGFLHYSERPVDVHFKLFQVLPDSLQRDLRRNLGYEEKETRPLKLEVGTEVSFDLSVHGTIHGHHHGSRSRKAGNQCQERENLKAQRILFLPPKSILTSKILGTAVEGVIAKQDAKQPYAGTVELKDALQTMTMKEHHPLVAQMINKYLSDTQATEPLVFHDIQSSKEDDVVIQLIESMAPQLLQWRHTTEADKEEIMQPPGKLVLTKVTGEVHPKLNEDPGIADDNISVDSCDVLSTASSDFGDGDAKPAGRKNRKKTRGHPKIIKAIRYDKGSLSNDLKKDVPPNIGDRVQVDIIQQRRTGVVGVHNMKIVERVSVVQDMNGGLGEEEDFHYGVVTEVVSQRKFGFISVMDETANRRESLFFQLSAIQGGGKSGSQNVRKNDEVSFKIGQEKTGKRIALHVTVLPRGTIPCKADKNACTGIVLLEPTHTELKNTKTLNNSHSTASSQSNGSSRWNSVDEKQLEEVPIKEQGCILLTADPSGMFSQKTDNETEDNEEGGEVSNVPSTNPVTKLYYKRGSVAIHGSGSSAPGDEETFPKRGDLVSFVRSKKEGGGLKDVRTMKRDATTLLVGKLTKIQHGSLTQSSLPSSIDPIQMGSAKFIVDDGKDTQITYDILLSEVVGCDVSVLKENESVEAILHEGALYGICRTSDLYLESKVMGGGPGSARKKDKQRPKLNLTVKKDRGGTIMAQSMMAKGPDGTNGFPPGWTTRVSRLVTN